jgi:hypothetical protein
VILKLIVYNLIIENETLAPVWGFVLPMAANPNGLNFNNEVMKDMVIKK